MRKPPKNPKCPLCGYGFDSGHVEIGVPFHCPICGRALHVDTDSPVLHRSFLAVLVSSHIVIGAGASYLLCYLAGARGDTLLVIGALGAVLIHHGLAYWDSNFRPLRIEPCPEDENLQRRIQQDAALLREVERSTPEDSSRC